MSYWRSIFWRAAKCAAKHLRIDSVIGIVNLLLINTIIGACLLFFTSKGGAGIPTRVASFLAPFLLFPIYFLASLIRAAEELNDERVSEIAKLTNRITELELEQNSDIIIKVNINRTIHMYTDRRDIFYSYNVEIENCGPSYLTNCVLKLSTANQFNLALHTRAWLHDASEIFDLRPGQVKSLIVLWAVEGQPEMGAYPQYYRPEQSSFWPGDDGGEVIPADQMAFLFAEVLSANTPPARLTMRVWCDDEWQIEAVLPGEIATFD